MSRESLVRIGCDALGGADNGGVNDVGGSSEARELARRAGEMKVKRNNVGSFDKRGDTRTPGASPTPRDHD